MDGQHDQDVSTGYPGPGGLGQEDSGDLSYTPIRSVQTVTDMTCGALADPSYRKDMRDLREAAIEDIAENAASEGWQSVTE